MDSYKEKATPGQMLVRRHICSIIIIRQHLYSALKSEDAEALVASGYDCLNK